MSKYNLSPRLTTRIEAASAPEPVDIESLSDEEFEQYWNNCDIHISQEAQYHFDRTLQKVEELLKQQQNKL